MTETVDDDFTAHMLQGAKMHAAMQPELALAEFEKALALMPGDLNAVSACAALLTELLRPLAAYRLLQSVQSQLLLDADGAANLAIAAETCGNLIQARQCYERALALQPNHLRTLNNLGLMASRDGLKDEAVSYARRCLQLMPQEHTFWLNLSDFLAGARRYDEAIKHLNEGLQRFPGSEELTLRHATVLAFSGRLEESALAFAALQPEALKHFIALTVPAKPVGDVSGAPRKQPTKLPDPYQLYTQSGFEALQACDWRDAGQLRAALQQMVADCMKSGTVRDMRDAHHYGIALGLDESALAQIQELSNAAIAADQPKGLPPYVYRPSLNADGRMHVGIAIQSLHDPRVANGLAAQLRLHDHARFCLHLYSPTPLPEERLIKALGAPDVNVAETAHLKDSEAIARMRFDRLDLFIDTTTSTQWWRPEIVSQRVAPVQVQQLSWHRHNPPQPCDYKLSDSFIHPDSDDLARYGAIARLPHTCWIDCRNDLPAPGGSLDQIREAMGIAQDALVLCAFLPAYTIDPSGFAGWMQMLRALPRAVLWLPAFRRDAQENLRREATSAGIDASRIIFSKLGAGPDARAETLAAMPVADLFVDAPRFNANRGLADALRMGVPAITCAGRSMASRLGGSIIRAAGLPECIFDDQTSYVAAAIELGKDAGKLARLKSQLKAARPTAPLFDTQARVRELEAAWTVMIKRFKAGLPPASFNVVSLSSTGSRI